VPPARRVAQVLGAGLLTVGLSSVWLLVVTLTPASSRPYVDGSRSNSVWQMLWEYDTFGRVSGNGRLGPNSFEIPVLRDGQVIPVDQGGNPGLTRLFGPQVGGQISWLIPLALALLCAGLVATRTAARADRTRAGWLVWGGWFVGYGL
jgi:hypothetical protein